MRIKKIYTPIIIAISVCIGVVIGSFIFGNTKYKFINQNANRYKLNRLIDVIENNFVDSVNTDSIIDLTVNNILDQLDPHSFYIPSNQQSLVQESMNGEFVGIGITYYMLNDTLAVINPIEGGPSIKAGIKSGDRILFANERKLFGEKITTDTLMSILKGELNSDIKLKVFRKSENKVLDLAFKRNKVPVKSVDVALKLNPTTGYIKINRFSATTHNEFKNALLSLKNNNATEFVIDLRNNGGGYVEIANKMIDEFLPENKTIVRLISKTNIEDKVLATQKGDFQTNKLYVIVDEGSASASEIFAGAIQDNDRGIILGRRTFGKGLVQQDMSLGDGSSVRLTVSKYHTPSGRSIQKPYALGNTEYNHDFSTRINSGELYHKDSIKIIDSVKYKTISGRKIYEGEGGIIPDVFVPLSNNHIETEIQYVMKSAFISNYIFQLIDNNRSDLANNSYEDLVNYLENTDHYYNKVATYLSKYPLKFNTDKYKNVIKKHVTAEILTQILSEQAGFKYLLPFDSEIQQIFEIQKQPNKYETLLNKYETLLNK